MFEPRGNKTNLHFPQRNSRESERQNVWGLRETGRESTVAETERQKSEQIETASLASAMRDLEKLLISQLVFVADFVPAQLFPFFICVHTSPSCGASENHR